MLMTFSTKPIDNHEDFNNWVPAVERLAIHFREKHGKEATHINVRDAEMAEKLKKIYGDKYKFFIGGCLPNELRLGCPQDGQPDVDHLRRHRERQQLEEANGVRPESKTGDKPVYDKESNTVTYGGIRFLDVHADDVMKLTKDPERFEWMKEMYDWVPEGDTPS